MTYIQPIYLYYLCCLFVQNGTNDLWPISSTKINDVKNSSNGDFKYKSRRKEPVIRCGQAELLVSSRVLQQLQLHRLAAHIAACTIAPSQVKNSLRQELNITKSVDYCWIFKFILKYKKWNYLTKGKLIFSCSIEIGDFIFLLFVSR